MPAVMGVSFLAILFFGKRMPKKGAEIGIASVGVCFLFALLAGFAWIDHVNKAQGSTAHEGAAHTAAVQEPPGGSEGEAGHAIEGEEEHATVTPIETGVTWFESGGQKFEAGTFVDGLSVVMLVVVSLISLPSLIRSRCPGRRGTTRRRAGRARGSPRGRRRRR